MAFRSLFLLASSVALLTSCATSRVEQMPSHNYGTRIKSLVLHFTAINYADSVKALVDEGGLSAHYLVPESGDPTYPDKVPKAIQLVDENQRAWHAGVSYWQGRTGLNDQSIGIEIVNVPDCQWDDDIVLTHAEHGSNRLCVFPDYDPKQIEVVIALAKDILKRNPDIEPTAVVGHADIAFDRKNDPGPRFPWYQLYQAGIGAWYDNDTLTRYWRKFNEQAPSLGLLQAAMRTYGYGVVETGIRDTHTMNALSAFQMHFMPWNVNGQPDSQTAAAVFALLDKYFPKQVEQLMARYDRENAAQPPSSHELRIGQIDRTFPDTDRSTREWVNDRARFKGYAGRGDIYLSSEQRASADVIVNGQKLNIAASLEPGKLYHYELNKRTQTGINTLKVENVTPTDAGVHITIPYPVLKDKADKHSKQFAAVDALINQDIAAGFPGAVLVVIKDGEIIKHTAYGYAKRYDENGELLADPTKMTLDTGFDLASNTKMFATTFALMHLVDEGKLDVTRSIDTYLPEYKGNGREGRRVQDLLSHQSGYAPEIQFFRPDNKLGAGFFSQDKQKTTELLTTKVPFTVGNGVQAAYSDTNFMLLGLIIERITGMPLDQYCEQLLYAPLGLSHTEFTPLKKGHQPDEFAATELKGNTRNGLIEFPNVRTYTLQGEVHDEKAFYSMGGVSGHAGLFSTAGDIAVLMQVLLNGGGYDGIHVFDSSVLNSFIKPDARHWGYGLGWRRAAEGKNRWHFGPYASDVAYGHTGWTGTVTVIDPALDLGIVLLTNARHTPIVMNDEGQPEFTGTTYETGKYGSVISLVYEAILNAQSAQK